MSKTCRKCNVELVIGVNWIESMKKHGNYKCKPCHTAITNKHYYDNKDIYSEHVKKHRNQQETGDYNVYLLENDNYVGVTKNIPYRMAVHKHYGKDIKAMRVLLQTKDLFKASELEELLHDMGYEGRHITNKPYWANVI